MCWAARPSASPPNPDPPAVDGGLQASRLDDPLQGTVPTLADRPRTRCRPSSPRHAKQRNAARRGYQARTKAPRGLSSPANGPPFPDRRAADIQHAVGKAVHRCPFVTGQKVVLSCTFGRLRRKRVRRAPHSQRRGHWFDPSTAHLSNALVSKVFSTECTFELLTLKTSGRDLG